MSKKTTEKISDDLRNVFQKRNFYTTKDAGNIFLFALILPLAFGLVFCFICMSIADGAGITAPEGSTILEELFANYLWFTIPYALLTQVVFLCVYLCYNKASRIQQKSCNISFKKANVWTSLLSALVGIISVLGLVLLIEGCFGKLFEVLGFEQSTLNLPIDTVGWYIANLFILGVAPAICEELIFRGVIFQGLKEKFSSTTSILLSALLFALMHQNIQQFIYPFLLGCVLAFTFERTNNLLYPILIHFFNNFATLTLSFLSEINVINLNFEITWWVVLIAIALAGITFLILWLIDRFYLRKQSKIEVEKQGELNQAPPMSIGKFPITILIGIVVAVVFIVMNAAM